MIKKILTAKYRKNVCIGAGAVMDALKHSNEVNILEDGNCEDGFAFVTVCIKYTHESDRAPIISKKKKS